MIWPFKKKETLEETLENIFQGSDYDFSVKFYEQWQEKIQSDYVDICDAYFVKVEEDAIYGTTLCKPWMHKNASFAYLGLDIESLYEIRYMLDTGFIYWGEGCDVDSNASGNELVSVYLFVRIADSFEDFIDKLGGIENVLSPLGRL